ncbi:MAG: NUDIX hydrolase [Oscillospiraceae bacterium]|nr:NUDIX hydrolase [Oscillospiraceae bacterium]
MDLREKKIEEKNIYKGNFLNLNVDTVQLPNGKISTREYFKHPGAVCILPIALNGDIIMVNQYRYPMGCCVLELPAGKLEKGENRENASSRELLEETGYESSCLEYIGEYYPAPAYVDEIIYMYKATGLIYRGQKLDDDEFLKVEQYSLKDIKKLLFDGSIKDGKTQACLYRYLFKNIDKGE